VTGARIETDSSITSAAEDKLDRSVFASRIAKRISMAGVGPSVVFGLAGAWGGGKTSALAMIREALLESPGWIVAEFTPWSANDLDALTSEFYEVIASAMPQKGKKGKTARKLLMSAAPLATSVAKVVAAGLIDHYAGEGTVKKVADAASSSTLDKLEDYAPSPDPFRQQFDAMADAIERTGARVLVIVDDLDRLHTDELLTVLKAVRLLGRFPGVHYLLSYDKRTVLDLICASDLARHDEDRARAYLEKIIQYPFELPPLQSVHSRREVTERLTAIAQQHNYDLVGTDAASGRTWDLVDEILNLLPFVDHTTLRAIYRWCAQIEVLLALLGPEHLDLLDAALITYLRLHHEKLYERLPTWRSKLVGDAPTAIFMASGRKRDSVEDWHTRLRTEDPDLDERAVAEFYTILCYLFPKLPRPLYTRTRPANNTPQIHDDEFFDRYFTFTLPVGDISDVIAKEEVSALIRHGYLPVDGVLEKFIEDGGQNKALALRKMHRELSHLITAVSDGDQTLTVLHHLWPKIVDEHQHLSWFGSTIDIAAMLTEHAVTSSSTPSEARAAVDRLRQHIGLREVTSLLAMFRRGRDVYPEPFADAISSVREEVLDTCVRDMSSPEPSPDLEVLSFVHFLTADMHAELLCRIDQAHLTQLDVAARFVARGGGRHEDLYGFCLNYFEELYPYAEWDLDQFPAPPTDGAAPDPDDDSADARRVKATYAVHEVAKAREA
jgi:hypothetical protein